MSTHRPPTDRRLADGSVSRPSKNNRQGLTHGADTADLAIGPGEMPDGTPRRPISVEPGRSLRDEAVMVQTENGTTIPISKLMDPPEGERKARPWYRVVNEWRDWFDRYRRSHIEFEKNGETVRTRLENSYQPEYGKRYYAKLKDLERGIEREYEGLTTAMLTLTASHENANGNPRCPADHMRSIAEGWNAARKQLHQVLSGRTWEYARVWEPHADGYGHLHIAVFVEEADDELMAERFRPVMESHVRSCDSAGWDAHRPGSNAVSVNDDVNNLGSYISEYIGIFGDETLERPITEQMFYAVTWATGTRRVDFSNGAQDIISREHFRRETGLRPSDRGAFEDWRGDGDTEAATEGAEAEPQDATEEGDEPEGDRPPPDGWECAAICTVHSKTPEYTDPTTGGADRTSITGSPGVDPEKQI